MFNNHSMLEKRKMSVFPLTAASECSAATRHLTKGCNSAFLTTVGKKRLSHLNNNLITPHHASTTNSQTQQVQVSSQGYIKRLSWKLRALKLPWTNLGKKGFCNWRWRWRWRHDDNHEDDCTLGLLTLYNIGAAKLCVHLYALVNNL